MVHTTVWIVLFVLFVVVEAITYQMISTWFAIGALFALIPASVGAGASWQIAVFLVVSALCLIALRPISVKCLKGKEYRSNSDALIGDRVLVTEDTDELRGRGEIKGMQWSLRSENDERIEAGQMAYVKRIEGVKLIVSKGE